MMCEKDADGKQNSMKFTRSGFYGGGNRGLEWTVKKNNFPTKFIRSKKKSDK